MRGIIVQICVQSAHQTSQARICTYTQMHMRIHTDAHRHVHKHASPHTSMYIHTRRTSHTHSLTYIHTHTHVLFSGKRKATLRLFSATSKSHSAPLLRASSSSICSANSTQQPRNSLMQHSCCSSYPRLPPRNRALYSGSCFLPGRTGMSGRLLAGQSAGGMRLCGWTHAQSSLCGFRTHASMLCASGLQARCVLVRA